MHITYFDEVKANPTNGQLYYTIGGVIAPMTAIGTLEKKMNALADKTFGSREPTAETEFHASHIYHGKGAFKGMESEKRVELLGKLATFISDARPDLKLAYASVNTLKLYKSESAATTAFAFFCERAQRALGRGNISVLIGDFDDQTFRKTVSEYAHYRAVGTPWAHGVELKRFIDGVHFARSHHSRMIQLADAYVFFATRNTSARKGWMADALNEILANANLFPDSYKYWPTE